MKLAILGSAGMVGQEILTQLAAGAGPKVEAVLGYDLIETPAPEGLSGVSTSIVGSMTEAAKLEQVLDARPDAIIHLASIVSGEAETDFDKGYQVNFDATYALIGAEGRAAMITGGDDSRPQLTYASEAFGASPATSPPRGATTGW
ncbi:MAG: NAD-dependent epimerase/dehydratase family protein [Alphaproteobacteria bacterium]